MSSKIERKRLKEQEVVGVMVGIYCRGKHKTGDVLCDECHELLEYARQRSAKCPFMENKTFCSNCKVHCYKPEMREKIKQVMRYSGPRMIFYHPIMAVWHVICSRRERAND